MEKTQKLYKFPLSYFWSMASNCVATKDGGLVYIGCKSINYIGPVTDENVAPEILTMNTRQSNICIDADPGWGSTSELERVKKYVAVLANDRSVQIWDIVTRQGVCGHKVHRVEGGPIMEGYNVNNSIVLLRFMKNRNVLSIDRTKIVNFCVASNTYYEFPNFLPKQMEVYTALQCSPNDEEIFVVGTNRGGIYVCNLQYNKVIYSLRNHNAPITSLKFTHFERTENIKDCKELKASGDSHAINSKKISSPQANSSFEERKSDGENKKTNQKEPLKENVHNKSKKNCSNRSRLPPVDNDDFLDIYNYDYLDNEFGAPAEKPAEKENDFVGIEKPSVTAEFDFNEACQTLKQEMQSRTVPQEQMQFEMNEVTLEDCQKTTVHCETSPSCSNADEPLGSSLELINDRSDVSIDGEEGEELDGKTEVQCQVDVHTMPPDENVSESDDIKDSPNLINESPQVDVLLSSACNNGKLCLWNIKTGIHLDNVTVRAKSKGRAKENIHMGWLTNNTLLVTAKTGDLCCYELQETRSLASSPSYRLILMKKNFESNSITQFDVTMGNLIWTMASSRIIRLENFDTGKVVLKYACLTSNINAMQENPDDMNKIALGLADRRIGILDISQLNAMHIPITNFSTEIDSQILCLTWNSDGTKLAFGTAEGRVGIIDYLKSVTNRTRNVVALDPTCGKEVIRIDWCGSEIFALCNANIAVYNDDMKRKSGHIIPRIRNLSSFSVRSSFLFAGIKTGALEIYKRSGSYEYERIQTMEIGQRYITDIAWSPIDRNRMVVTANCNTIAIVEYNFHIGKATLLNKLPLLNEPKCSFSHARWSFSDPYKFLTCGLDGSVRIWNIKTLDQKHHEYIRYFNAPILCSMFWPDDENILLCASKSSSLEMIDIRDKMEKSKPKTIHDPISSILWACEAIKCSKLTPVEKRRLRRQKESALKDEENKENASETTNESVEAVNSRMRMLKVAGEPNMIEEDLNISLKEGGNVFHKVPNTVLCMITKEMNKYPLEKMKLVLGSKSFNKAHSEDILSYKLFSDKNDARIVLSEELNNHKISASKGVQHLFLPQLGESLKDEILKAITAKQLNEWLVSLAPTVSYSFWEKTVEAFAQQLLEQGYTLQAASYMIATHKFYEAIDVLLNGNLYKEAMLVGRIYLQKDDPLLKSIYEKWLKYLEAKGGFYTAAFLCVLNQDYQRAHEFLTRVLRRTPEVEDLLHMLNPLLK